MTPKARGIKQPFSFALDFVDQELGKAPLSDYHRNLLCAHTSMFSAAVVL